MSLTVTEHLLARIMARVDKNGPPPPNPSRPVEGGCWLWTGGKFPAGYGSISVGNSAQLVHRLAYVGLVGPIPEGFDIDHVCRVRPCCRPGHTEPVTRAENIIRAQRPTCRRGHVMDSTNTGPVKGKPTRRVCRECSAEKTRRWRAARAS